MSAYAADLAGIHDAGFGHIATHGAALLIDTLARAGVTSGLVVELGCGSGISCAALDAAGYAVLGVDLSEAMLELARARVPGARFAQGSWLDASLPPCVAITAFGEVLNYGFDARNGALARAALFARAHAALAPGGVLLFDIATPERAPAAPHSHAREDADWAVLVHVEADAARTTLTRRITSFRREGALFRRSEETHTLQLVPADTLQDELRAAGFSVTRARAYGELALPAGLDVFCARKPA